MTPAVGARQVPSKDAAGSATPVCRRRSSARAASWPTRRPACWMSSILSAPGGGHGVHRHHPVRAARSTRTVLLVDPQLHLDQGTLAERLLLTIRARISAVEVGGILGQTLAVEVIMNQGTSHERPLGALTGRYGGGGEDWQEFVLEVHTADVRFPTDPCPGQAAGSSCGQEIVPVPNELTFVFTGINFPAVMEVDWLMLEPMDDPGLAWRPVLLVHGLGTSGIKMAAGTAWFEGLRRRDVACHAPDFTRRGSIVNNGAEITLAVDDMKRRFGVERVHILAHSSGGIHAREHVRSHDDVETLITLGTPHAGSFIADCFAPLGLFVAASSVKPLWTRRGSRR